MTKSEMIYRFNCYGTIGNESELTAVVPGRSYTSFHVIGEDGEEIAIKYSMRAAVSAMRSLSDSIKFKPILSQYV